MEEKPSDWEIRGKRKNTAERGERIREREGEGGTGKGGGDGGGSGGYA